MRITKKQQDEIDFLVRHFGADPTTKQIKEYIGYTSCGEGDKMYKDSDNPLFQAKRRLDINVKLWTEDMKAGILFPDELRKEFNCEFATKMINNIAGMQGSEPETKKELPKTEVSPEQAREEILKLPQFVTCEYCIREDGAFNFTMRDKRDIRCGVAFFLTKRGFKMGLRDIMRFAETRTKT